MLLHSFGFALEGLRHLLATQRNFRIEVGIGLLAVTAGLVLGLTVAEWAVLVLTIAVVLTLEGLNTTLELAVDLASPEVHPKAKAAKDIAAGMVLVAAIASIVIGALLFGPKLDK